MEIKVSCPYCGGSGYYDYGENSEGKYPIACFDCYGSGYIEQNLESLGNTAEADEAEE